MSKKLLQQAVSAPQNFRFSDMVKLAKAFGFRLSRRSGSHHIYIHPRVTELLNLQEVRGKAKPSDSSVSQTCGKIQSGACRGPMKDYHINIFFSQEDEGYIADILDLAMCSAFGRTPAEELAEFETVRKLSLEAARAEGKPIPEPTYRPVIYQLAS